MAVLDSYVFLSYASADQERVADLAGALERAGVRVWVDRSGIPGGANYGPEIVTAIRESGALLLCCSAAAFASRNVRQEVALAWKHERPLVPLLLEPVGIPDELAYWLEAAQWIEVLDRPEASWLPEVVRALHRIGVMIEVSQPPLSAGGLQPWRQVRLPTPLTSLLGREAEVRAIADQLASHRLVTLTGPGGVGKTRLAVEAAGQMAGSFPDGVWFVDLAPVRSPSLVLSTIAQAIGVQEPAGIPMVDVLSAAIGQRRMLLLLDNLEQVIEGTPQLVSLLTATPRLVILATSRTVLDARGEAVVAVDPLPVSADATYVPLTELRQSAAVRLFAERATLGHPGFELTDDNTLTVAAICARLDGLPLAIELAAARLRLMTPEVLLSRLDRRLTALTGGARDLPDRQRTLRDTIAWSYDQLDLREQVALRRLAVFVGGCSLDAAEAVVTRESDSDSGEVLSGLIDKSLVRQVVRNGEPRLLILETIREFAIEQLEASGELEQLQQRHAAYFLARAEEAAPAWWGPEPTYWLDRLEVERDNLRAAIRWSLQDPESDLAVRLVIAFWWFIRIRGPVREGRTWTDQLVAQGIRGSASLWANLLVAAGDFARVEGDLARQEAFNWEALAVVDEERHPEIVSWCYLSLSLAAANAGDRDRAVTSGEASLDAARRARLPHLINRALDILSSVHREWGESTRAAELLDEAVTLSESEGMAWDAAHVRSHRADIAADLGDTSRAMELYGDSLRRLFALGDYRGFLGALAGYASLVTVLGDAVHGTRLCGAITSLLPSLGAVLGPNGQQGLDRALTAARAVLDEAAFEAALESGRHLSLQQLRREVEDIASPVGPSVGLAAAPAARVETSPTGPGCGNDNQVQDGPVADLKP